MNYNSLIIFGLVWSFGDCQTRMVKVDALNVQVEGGSVDKPYVRNNMGWYYWYTKPVPWGSTPAEGKFLFKSFTVYCQEGQKLKMQVWADNGYYLIYGPLADAYLGELDLKETCGKLKEKTLTKQTEKCETTGKCTKLNWDIKFSME